MKQQAINLKYSLARAKALSHYLEKEGKTIEGELLEHISELYDKQVPEVVREFVASQNPEDEQTNALSEEQKRESSARPAGKKKHTQTEDIGNTQSGSGPVLAM